MVRADMSVFKMKIFWAISLATLAACSGPQDRASESIKVAAQSTPITAPDPKPSEYFMTYKVNGKRVTLNSAIVRNFQNDVRYKIDGSSRVQGDINVVVIQHDDGPPREGTFSTNEGNLVFILGMNDDAGSWSTLNLTDMSFGIGEFTISEVTDAYAKGTFNFIADWSGEDAPDKRFEITDGRFKARMGHPF